MHALVSGRGQLLLIGICVAAALVSWAVGSPLGLLALVAAIALVAPLWLALLSPAILAIAFFFVAQLRGDQSPSDQQAHWQIAIFIAAGMLIAAIVARKGLGPSDMLDAEGRPDRREPARLDR